MKNSNSKLRKQVGIFGTAIAALAGAEAAEGAVVSLTPNPATQPFQGAASAGSNISLGSPGLTFFQFNDTLGKTLRPGPGGFSWRSTTFGNVITTGLGFQSNRGIGTSATGTETFAFLTSSNQVGWIRIHLGGTGGAITYLAAAFQNTPGDPIVAGGAAVPEPATVGLFGLGVLAMGAAGVRRLRKKKAQQA